MLVLYFKNCNFAFVYTLVNSYMLSRLYNIRLNIEMSVVKR